MNVGEAIGTHDPSGGGGGGVASAVINDSGVPGANVKNALDNLDGAIVSYNRTEQEYISWGSGVVKTLTHAPYNIDGYDFYIDIYAEVTLADANIVRPGLTVFENVTVAGLNWVRDGAASGHFDVAPGSRVKVGCWLFVGATYSAIMTMGADPTLPNSVTIQVDVLASGVVVKINGCWNNTSTLDLTYGVDYPQNASYAGIQATPMDFSIPAIDHLHAPTTQVSFFTGGRARMCWSKDAGLTWYYHDGTDWVTCLLSELNTGKGCVASGFINAKVKDALGVDLTDLSWNTFAKGFSITEAVGILSTTNNRCVFTVSTYSYGQVNAKGKLSYGMYTGGGSPILQMNVKRISDTQVAITNATMGTFPKVRVLVRTP